MPLRIFSKKNYKFFFLIYYPLIFFILYNCSMCIMKYTNRILHNYIDEQITSKL